MTRKLLEPVEPYNELFYKSCFYSALFSAFGCLGRDETRFLFNDLFVYRFDERVSQLDLLAVPLHPEPELYRLTGIDVHVEPETESVVSSLVRAIDRHRPVILFIDCFYEPIRPDTYQKLHMPHFILVFGYDSAREIFHIVEHRYRDSLRYERRELGFDDVARCYEGAKRHFENKRNLPNFMAFSVDDRRDPPISGELARQAVRDFAAHALDGKERLLASLSEIKRFAASLQDVAASESVLKEWVRELFRHWPSSLTRILHNKTLEKHRLLKLSFPPPVVELLEKSLKSWQLVRSVLYKYKENAVYNPRSVDYLLAKTEALFETESAYYAQFYDCLPHRMNEFILTAERG